MEHVLSKWHFWASKFSKSSHWPQILYKTEKEYAFYENCTKRSFQVRRSTFWTNRIFERQKLSKSSQWPEILAKTGKQYPFHQNHTKRSFQVMRSTFRPNRILERQSFQNRETSLKFSSKRENSALFMNNVKNAFFRSCEARFAQMAFLSIKVLKIVTLAPNSIQNGKKVRFLWKLYKTLFSGHAEHVLAKSHFWGSKYSKSWNWPQILFKTGKQCAFHENCTKRSFQAMRSTFWPKSQFWPSESTKSSHWRAILLKRKNRALFIKILQNTLFRSSAARFGQIAFLSVEVLKMVKLDSNSLQNGKTLRFLRKLYKTLFSGHAQYVLAKSHFWPSKFLKSSQWPEFLSKKRKQCAFL